MAPVASKKKNLPKKRGKVFGGKIRKKIVDWVKKEKEDQFEDFIKQRHDMKEKIWGFAGLEKTNPNYLSEFVDWYNQKHKSQKEQKRWWRERMLTDIEERNRFVVSHPWWLAEMFSGHQHKLDYDKFMHPHLQDSGEFATKNTPTRGLIDRSGDDLLYNRIFQDAVNAKHNVKILNKYFPMELDRYGLPVKAKPFPNLSLKKKLRHKVFSDLKKTEKQWIRKWPQQQGGFDIHKWIEKLPHPKGGWTLPGQR